MATEIKDLSDHAASTASYVAVQDGGGSGGKETIADILALFTGSTSIVTVGTVTSGTWSATAIAVAKGGTGATTAADARTNLGLVIGTDVQAYDADLAALGGLAKDDGNFIVADGAAWTVESGSTARTSLGLGNVENTALSTWAGTVNVTTIGTIATGIWQATAVGVAYGGTGLTALGSALQVLRVNSGATGLEYAALAGGGDALKADPLSQFAATTSSQLAGVISDETGTGLLVFGTAPTFASTITVGTAGGTTGAALLKGTTSGTVTLSVADAAGTHTIKLPIADGSANQVLKTDGSGQWGWASAGAGDALTANPLSQFAATTSAQLAGVISDETGSGALVFATSPTLVTPALGTPASGVLTNCTGLPTAGLVDDAVTYAKMQNVSATDKVLGRSSSGSGDVEEIACTSAGRALIDDADASAQRTTLGLAIGTNVQAYSARLTHFGTALDALGYEGLLIRTEIDAYEIRTLTGTSNQITVTNGTGVAGNPTISLPSDVLIPTVLTCPNAGLHLLDTNASHDLIVSPGSDLTADRTLTITTGDANRTLDISAASVTVSSFGATLVDDADASTARTTLGLGTSAVVDTGTSGTKVALTDGANQWSAAQRFINSSGITILDTNDSHTLGLIVGSNLTANRTLTITTGDASRTLTLSGDTTLTGTNSGDVTLSGSYDYITISSQTITVGQIDLTTDVTGDLPLSNLAQAGAASRLLGRGSASGAGDWEAITLGSKLSMSTTTLNTSAIADVVDDTSPQLGGDLDCNGNTIHFGTSENTQTPSGTTATIDLGAENHHTLDCGSASGAVTLTLTVPPGPTAGTIIVKQGATARDITWSPSSGSVKWMMTEPTWDADTSKYRVVSWRWNASILFLTATEAVA